MNFTQIHEVISSRNFCEAIIRENKSSQNFSFKPHFSFLISSLSILVIFMSFVEESPYIFTSF